MEPQAAPCLALLSATELVRRFNSCQRYHSHSFAFDGSSDTVKHECTLIKNIALQVN